MSITKAPTSDRGTTETIQGYKDPDWMSYDTEDLARFTVLFLAPFLTAVMQEALDGNENSYREHGVRGANSLFTRLLIAKLQQIESDPSTHPAILEQMRPIVAEIDPAHAEHMDSTTCADELAQLVVLSTLLVNPVTGVPSGLTTVPWRLSISMDGAYVSPMHPSKWLQSVYDDHAHCGSATPFTTRVLQQIATMLGNFRLIIY